MVANGRAERMERRLTPVEPALLTVSRRELLSDGSDVEFRALVHRLMSFTRFIGMTREGLGALAGVTGVQYEIMMWVSRLQGADGVTVGEIGAAMRQSGAFTTIEAGKLVEKGLLEKSADLKDRRRVRLRYTAKWQNTLRAVCPYQQQINDAVFASLTPRDLQELNRIFRDLLVGADRGTHLIDFILKEQEGAAAQNGF